MHIAASLMTVMARPSCTTVRLFGASHCHVLPLRPACTVVMRCTVVGDRLPWGGERQGGGGVVAPQALNIFFGAHGME